MIATTRYLANNMWWEMPEQLKHGLCDWYLFNFYWFGGRRD